MQNSHSHHEERWDIYDRNKQRTGRTMRRNDFTLADDEYHLSVLGVVRTPDGRFLITRRKMDKRWAPGWWEVPGGGVMAGEDSYEAAVREVFEETGVDVSAAGGVFAFDYHRENPGEGDNYFVDIYLFTRQISEEDVHLQESETTGFRLATADEIRALAEEGIFLHYQSIRAVFEMD